jgi:hypothetical protein
MNNAINEAYQTLEKQANDLYTQIDHLEKAIALLKPMVNLTAKKVAVVSNANDATNLIESTGGFVEWRALERKAKGKSITEVSSQTSRGYYTIRLKDYAIISKNGHPKTSEIARYQTKDEAYTMRDQLTAILEGR